MEQAAAVEQYFQRYNSDPAQLCTYKNIFFAGSSHRFDNKTLLAQFGNDIIVGNFRENINDGKSYEWFLTAQDHFPRSDFLFKADMDTVVNLTAFCEALRPLDSSKYYYIGRYPAHFEECNYMIDRCKLETLYSYSI